MPITAGKTAEERYNNAMDVALKLKRPDRKGHLTLVTARAFYGKTAFTRKTVYDWAVKRRFHNDYDLILLVPLRYVPVKKKNHNGFEYETILDMTVAWINKFCDVAEFKFLARLRDRATDETVKVLIIIDGYDEERSRLCDELDRLLQHYQLPKTFNYDLMVTRRPSKDINKQWKVQIESRSVCQLTIKGFTTIEQRTEFIKRHFRRAEQSRQIYMGEKLDSILRQVDENKFADETLETPMVLLFLSLICECDENEIERINHVFNARLRS